MSPLVRERLRAGGIDRFVDMLVEDILDRRADELLDPAWMALQLAQAAKSAANDPQVERWFRDRITDARQRVPSGTARLPPEISRPLAEVLRRPYVPDRAIVGRLLDHDTARLLLRNLFGDLLITFARKLRPPMATSAIKFGGLKRFGEGVLGAVGHELEAQVEAKAREFMDAGIHRLVDQFADHLCDPALTREYGEWRAYGLEVLMATEARTLAGEVEKLDPDALVATGAALVRGLVGREELPTQLEAILTTALTAGGDRTVRSLLGGLEAHGTGFARDLLVQRARALIETDAFEHWWDDITG